MNDEVRIGASDSRRGFFEKLTAWGCGAAAILTPVALGKVAFFSPLWQKGQAGKFVRVATLDGVPDDGVPRKFQVITDRVDGWTRFVNEPVGAVFLRRQPGSQQVAALQVICPHAGCAIGYEAASGGGKFFCPCHGASFDVSGARADANSPSPRDMDSLEVEVRNGGEIWVNFQDFMTNKPEKIAKV